MSGSDNRSDWLACLLDQLEAARKLGEEVADPQACVAAISAKARLLGLESTNLTHTHHHHVVGAGISREDALNLAAMAEVGEATKH